MKQRGGAGGTNDAGEYGKSGVPARESEIRFREKGNFWWGRMPDGIAARWSARPTLEYGSNRRGPRKTLKGANDGERGKEAGFTRDFAILAGEVCGGRVR